MPQKLKEKFENIYIQDQKICCNPLCFEVVLPPNRKYCCEECSSLGKQKNPLQQNIKSPLKNKEIILQLLSDWWKVLRQMFFKQKGEMVASMGYEKLKHKLKAIDEKLVLKLQDNKRIKDLPSFK